MSRKKRPRKPVTARKPSTEKKVSWWKRPIAWTVGVAGAAVIAFATAAGKSLYGVVTSQAGISATVVDGSWIYAMGDESVVTPGLTSAPQSSFPQGEKAGTK